MEHVFNFPIAIRNCMEMVSVGGHLMLITPANNFFGHGFYQFSPELFYSLLSQDNGYINTRIFMQDDHSNWFEVLSPKEIGMRVDVCCARHTPALMTVLSQRSGEMPNNLSVLQSDYVAIWTQKNLDNANYSSASFISRLYQAIPLRVRERLSPFLRNILGINKRFYQSRLSTYYKRCATFPILDKAKNG